MSFRRQDRIQKISNPLFDKEMHTEIVRVKCSCLRADFCAKIARLR